MRPASGRGSSARASRGTPERPRRSRPSGWPPAAAPPRARAAPRATAVARARRAASSSPRRASAAPRTSAASSATRPANSAAGISSDTSPQSSASAALRRRFETIHSKDLANPSRRWMNQVPPASGTRPIPMKPGTKVASDEATRTSQAHASDSPAPAQAPLIAASTGFSSARIARTFGWYVASRASRTPPGSSWNSRRSWPAQKPRPAPVRTTARIAGSAASRERRGEPLVHRPVDRVVDVRAVECDRENRAFA